jgi:hypothetical protein
VLTLTRLEPRDTPTTLSLTFTGEWWTPARRAVAEAVAAEVSAKIDVPGYSEWAVELIAVPTYPLIAEATGTGGWGKVWVGPATAAYDLGTVLRHEVGTHALGVMAHGTDPAGVAYGQLAPGEVRTWRPSDDELLRAGGLIVVVPAAEAEVPSTAAVLPDPPAEAPPYTEADPYRGPLVRVGLWNGWADVPPRVAELWGLS